MGATRAFRSPWTFGRSFAPAGATRAFRSPWTFGDLRAERLLILLAAFRARFAIPAHLLPLEAG